MLFPICFTTFFSVIISAKDNNKRAVYKYTLLNKNKRYNIYVVNIKNPRSLLIRKSGTEPLLRFYIESDTLEKVEKIKKFVKGSI